MKIGIGCLFFFLFPSLLFLLLPFSTGGAAIGICYGRVADNLPPPSQVIDILRSNGISTTRIFKADAPTLQSFSGTGISLMIGVPNEILPSLASGTQFFSLEWLETTILSHLPSNQVRYIAVGNEVFSKDPFYSPYVVPAMINLYQALQALNLTDSIKLSSPQAASVLSVSYPPSAGAFNPYLQSVMVPLLQFLQNTESPFMINVYPYISYLNGFESVTLDYALFRSGEKEVKDGRLTYGNLFDASVDAVVYAMEREGYEGIPVVVSETGWPTRGGLGASEENASAYNGNVVRRVLSDAGTPKMPGRGLEVYLFDMFDENGKGGEEYEKHFGIFGFDGLKLYHLPFN